MKLLIIFHLLMWMFLNCLIPLSVNAQGGGILQVIDQLPEGEQLIAYRMLVDKDPQNARFQNSLGFCYYRMEDYDMAEQHYSKALTLEPTYSTAYNNLGVIYLKKEQYDVSRHYFKKALHYNPYNVKAMYNLGITYFRKGNYFKALRCYSKVKKMDENYVKERDNIERMREEVDEALRRDSGNQVLKKVRLYLN